MTTKKERRVGTDLYTFEDEKETKPNTHGVENAIRGTVGTFLFMAPEVVLESQYYPYPTDIGAWPLSCWRRTTPGMMLLGIL